MSSRQSLQHRAIGDVPSKPVMACSAHNPSAENICEQMGQTEEHPVAAEMLKYLISHGENMHFFQPFSGLTRHQTDLEAQQNGGF